MFPDLINLDDVRMLKPGGGPRLAEKPIPLVRPGQGASPQQLERHHPPEPPVHGPGRRRPCPHVRFHR